MAYQKRAAVALAGVVICGAAVFWSTRQETPKETQLAGVYYRARAEHGDAEAQYRLGAAYYYGEGVAPDLAEAVRWTRGAADRGYPKAQCQFAYLYYAGKGVPQNAAESL